MIIKSKPTAKRNRMAVILQSRYNHPCYFCGDPDTVSVDTVDADYRDERYSDYSKYKEGIMVRHKCLKHRLFGFWPAEASVWGWHE